METVNTRLKRDLITLGRIKGPYGVQGWLHCVSFCEQADDLFHYEPLLLKTRYGVKELIASEWRLHRLAGSKPSDQAKGLSYIVLFEGISNRDQAEALVNAEVAVAREQLPALADDEVYIRDLVDLEVRNTDDQLLGRVSQVLETGANDVCVVRATKDSIDDQERMVPYVLGTYIQSVDLDRKLITVDWPADW